MTRYEFRENLTASFIAAIFAFLLIAGNTFAIGSGSKDEEKSPEEQKQEQLQKATKHYNKGVEHMEKARKKAATADSTFAFNYRATSNDKARREYEKAVDEFKEALVLQPEMVEAHNNLAYCFRKLGMIEESLRQYKRALVIDSSYALAREYLGETYLAMGDLEMANMQHAWLVEHKSVYADTLAQAINLFKLKGISEQIDKANGK